MYVYLFLIKNSCLIYNVKILNSNNIFFSTRNKSVQQSVKYERPDTFLIPKEPGRSGPPAKISEKTNIHILVEFGLQVI